jgi:hypothetical protein
LPRFYTSPNEVALHAHGGPGIRMHFDGTVVEMPRFKRSEEPQQQEEQGRKHGGEEGVGPGQAPDAWRTSRADGP